ncbi:LamG domain-containing protein [Arcticibacter tournemirensis]|uniref:LamG domain-containing protein n=1 Tax=Arcticibacter tournemirensis TaxID=699437 RepID=A0A4V1KHT1_9SPHI|nr:LamG domain-containing protein [Arcticibacter tournemirensis]RXF68272.1 LamG domain-containing protein [Arcticibacter tournemirensis]
MKSKIFNIAAAVVISFAASSCTDKFDPSTYAPPLSIDGYTSTKQVAPESLVAHWAFDGGLSDSVSQTVGTASGTSFASGVKGQALQGALNGYVVSNTPEKVQKLTSFTITCWVKSALNTNGIVGLVDIANTTSFWGNLTLFFENGGSSTTGKLTARTYEGVVNNGGDNFIGLTDPWNRWIHVAYSYNESNSTYTVYYNGTKVGSKVVAGLGALSFKNASKMVFGTTQFQTTPSLTTGAEKQGWASYLTGQLDEVRIYNKALSASEVSVLQRLEARGK